MIKIQLKNILLLLNSEEKIFLFVLYMKFNANQILIQKIDCSIMDPDCGQQGAVRCHLCETNVL